MKTNTRSPSALSNQGKYSKRFVWLISGLGCMSSQRLGSWVASGEFDRVGSVRSRGVVRLMVSSRVFAVRFMRVRISFSNFPIKVMPLSPLRFVLLWAVSVMFPPNSACKSVRYVGWRFVVTNFSNASREFSLSAWKLFSSAILSPSVT